MSLCTKENIQLASDHCAFIRENCPTQNFIQFIDIYYCKIDESIPFLVFFTVIQIFKQINPFF